LRPVSNVPSGHFHSVPVDCLGEYAHSFFLKKVV
jgi:hypothetical protein